MARWAVRALAIAIALLTVASNANAAVLSTTGSGTKVNSGNGFHDVPAIAMVKPGDVILVASHSSAVLTYGEGCSVKIASGRIVRVAHRAPCANGATRAKLYRKFGKPMGAGQPPYGGPPVPVVGGTAAGVGQTVGMVAGIAGAVTIAGVIVYKAANPNPASP